ncbi:hypothetical protein ZHAS_00017955 [Anopheles sinensis]|uniref:Uncharacterized protein n=1 Tax=Anopheles sinensis TaxID=74873 RepID=A0A084WI79_ANOSI|nr:hypothetical protein ZHAS_00017955 [Anopheles sinensis]
MPTKRKVPDRLDLSVQSASRHVSTRPRVGRWVTMRGKATFPNCSFVQHRLHPRLGLPATATTSNHDFRGLFLGRDPFTFPNVPK